MPLKFTLETPCKPASRIIFHKYFHRMSPLTKNVYFLARNFIAVTILASNIFCLNLNFRVIYGSTDNVLNEDGSNAVLKIQGRCLFFHETFTNSAVAIEKARFYFSNWHIFQQTR